MSLIGVCAFLFVTITLLDMAGGLARWGMQPVAIALEDQWFRLVSAMFLHAGWLHIGFNMYVLYILGPPLERVLGHGRFLTLYLLSGIGGSVASYWFSPVNTLSVGASGAIFGLMTAWIVVGRRLGSGRDADHRPAGDQRRPRVRHGWRGLAGPPRRRGDRRAGRARAHHGPGPAGSRPAGPAVRSGCRRCLVVLIALAVVRTAQIQDMVPALLG